MDVVVLDEVVDISWDLDLNLDCNRARDRCDSSSGCRYKPVVQSGGILA